MSHPHLSPHQKKKLQLLKNKKQQKLFHIMHMQQEEHERKVEEFEEQGRIAKKRGQDQRSSKKGEEEVWSAKVNKVRNRLTGRKRASKERWNRFAGTSDGGGRGL